MSRLAPRAKDDGIVGMKNERKVGTVDCREGYTQSPSGVQIKNNQKHIINKVHNLVIFSVDLRQRISSSHICISCNAAMMSKISTVLLTVNP
ncbi:hypothetical protein BaRGS_00017829 [Batillaria attramentaria]|uniref:Uncharacterized protein n=1 Tax=Batillaria attramentaria TaxID=370345 RepID=A0ABD0KV19_9CAEN